MDIIVFQQFGSAERKISGIKKYGKNITIKDLISLDQYFPDIIEYPEQYLCEDFCADLVLNYLKHPDLSTYLVEICEKKGIPIVTTGRNGKGFTPFTCCGLGKSERLGEYGKQFGFPEYAIKVKDGIIESIGVKRGAPCLATWEAMRGIVGMSLEEAMVKLPLKVQQNCFADPSGFDPIYGKSPVHYAAYVHLAAIKKAVEKTESKGMKKEKTVL